MTEQDQTLFDPRTTTPPTCPSCGRLVAKNEPAMWFTGWPNHVVYGTCCWHLAAVAA